MESVTVQDQTCGVFRRLQPDELEPDAIHRFVVGEDRALRKFSAEEAAAELGDPFATHLLLRGTFPVTAEGVMGALAKAVAAGDPLARTLTFLVGEGSQVPFSPQTARLARGLRFLATTGPGAEGPDVVLSAGRPESGDVELMAWDRERGGFNFYRTIGDNSAWVFAGNSRHAVSEATEGRGPFESHTSGNLVMKELRLPWLHWHSFQANILPGVFAADDPLRGHPWFTQKDASGAPTLEASVVKPGIERWTRTRFERMTSGEELVVERPARLMEQIAATPSVNLIASHTESRAASLAGEVDLPQTFFADTEALVEVLELQAPPRFTVSAELYTRSLETFEFRISDEDGFEQPGDTHFAFFVPERAFEDTALLREAIAVGLVSKRLAACMLMTDFANPIFSERRRRLLAHVPARATVSGGHSDFSESLGEAITDPEFVALWAAGDDWRDAANVRLADYFAAVGRRLTTQEGFDAYCRLAESRRAQVRETTPLVEFALLFAKTNIPAAARSMRADGTVEEG